MAGQLTYRLFEEADLPGVLRLWAENTGWGELTPEAWRRWYVDTPQGPALVVVAVDVAGDVVGQVVFTPSNAWIGDCEVPALRLSAPILRQDLRLPSLQNVDHPVIGLYLAGARAATEQGYGFVYSLPERAWLPWFLRWGQRIDLARWAAAWGPAVPLPRWAGAEYPCVAAPLVAVPQSSGGNTKRLVARPTTSFGVEHDALWRAARNTFPIACGVVRSSERLRYNSQAGQARAALGNQGYLALDVCDAGSGELAGYAAIFKPGTHTALLVDALARCPADLAPVVAAALNWLALEYGEAPAGSPLTGETPRLNAMETQALRPVLRGLGFVPVDYRFAFVCTPLGACVPAEAIAPERWYVMPGD